MEPLSLIVHPFADRGPFVGPEAELLCPSINLIAVVNDARAVEERNGLQCTSPGGYTDLRKYMLRPPEGRRGDSPFSASGARSDD